MTYKEIERRGYLQGKSEGKEEEKTAVVEEINKALDSGLISSEAADKLISNINNK